MCFLLSPLHWSAEETVGDAHGMMEEPCLGLGKRGVVSQCIAVTCSEVVGPSVSFVGK
jgi:hypothetical protein